MAKPMIAWMGGKRRLAKDILKLMPEHTCYVEAFAGGAAIYFSKEPSKVEVINDLNGELVNLYRVVQNHLEEFVRQLKWALVSRKVFEWEKMKNLETLTDIQRAARFFYVQKTCFGARATGPTFGTSTTSKPKFNLLRIEEDLSAVHLRLCQTTIECLPWEKIIEKYDRPHTLFYMDPPYWGTAGYGISFGMEEYLNMAALMRSMKGKGIISVNDHPDMLDVFKEFEISSVKVRYTISGGKGAKMAGELIIRNF